MIYRYTPLYLFKNLGMTLIVLFHAHPQPQLRLEDQPGKKGDMPSGPSTLGDKHGKRHGKTM